MKGDWSEEELYQEIDDLNAQIKELDSQRTLANQQLAEFQKNGVCQRDNTKPYCKPNALVDCECEWDRFDALKKQLAEKDKEIEHHAELSAAYHKLIYKQLSEIASLKKALRKARSFVGNSETHTLSDEKTVSTFIDEIENLLK